MAKVKEDIPVEIWLNVASDALARYAAAGQLVEIVAAEGGLVIRLPGVGADDLRLAGSFLKFVRQEVTA